jgi:hypothetical protein
MTRARSSILVLLALAGLSVSARAQDRSDALRTELTSVERRTADTSAPPRDREQSADRAIELRRQLISQVPESDPRLPEMLAAQGAALLDRLSRDGADSAMLFGLPTPAQKQLVHASALEAESVLARGATLAEALRDRLGGATSDKPGAPEADQLASVRFPFFRARTEVLMAAQDPAARTTLGGRAADRLSRMTLVSPSAEAARRATLAAALIERADPPALSDLQSAAEEVGWVITSSEAASAAPAVRIEAWQALIHIAASQSRLDAVLNEADAALKKRPFIDPQGRVDALAAVLIADATTRVLWEQGVRERRAEALARATKVQESLLARTDLSIRAETLAPLVFDKLAALDLPAESGLSRPSIVTLARAVVAARDPSRREIALAEFQRLADDPESGAYAADALWERCVMLLQPPKGRTQAPDAARLEAVRSLIALARRFPDHARAPEALSAALLHARALAGIESPAGEAPIEAGTRAAAQRSYRDALLLATETLTTLPDINAWRFERARLADQDLASGAISDDDLRGAIVALREIPAEPAKPLSAENTRRLGERLQLALIDRWRERLAVLRQSGSDAEMRALAVEHLAVEAKRASDWAKERQSPLADRFRADAADALVEGGDASAANVYADLLSRNAIVPGGVSRLELGLGRALLLEAKDAEAFAALKHAAEHDDAPTDPAKPGSRPEAFWHAWTLMLETLLRQNAATDRSSAIRVHLRRLSTIDPDLGGEPWRSRLARVQESVK